MKKKLFSTILALVCAICCMFSLVACNDGDNPQTVAVTLTENTDFSAIESEKVTESEWRAAFAESTYTNVTIKTTRKDNAENPNVWKHTQNTWLIESDFGNQYMIETTDKFVTVYSGSIMNSDEDYIGIEYDDPDAKGWFWDWQCSYTMASPDFSDYFSDFTYDETLKAYTLNNTIELPYSPYEYMAFHCDYGIIKIVNGRLAYVYFGQYDDKTDSIQKMNETEVVFYNFDITEISVPNNYTLMDLSEME